MIGYGFVTISSLESRTFQIIPVQASHLWTVCDDTYIKCSTKPFVPISIKVFHYCDRHNMVALNQNHLSLMARAVLIVKTIIWLRQIQKLRAKVCSRPPHKTLLVNRFNYFHIELWNSSAFKEICFIFLSGFSQYNQQYLCPKEVHNFKWCVLLLRQLRLLFIIVQMAQFFKKQGCCFIRFLCWDEIGSTREEKKGLL